ncbi:terminase large subunit domain-containing protein [Mycobacteroides abscessus subsp. abscessus]|uniref:terminase large subunit domain-containing protein n=1 Tax=Mycobacteroides abscessus TaxID=36809 RepID=UPI0039EE9B5D
MSVTTVDPTRLAAVRVQQATRGRQEPTSPAELARRIVRNYRITPAIELISDVISDAITQPGRRYIITTPPRTGKSVLVSRVGVVDALRRNPDAQIILASYSDELAQDHSREARAMIAEHADLLGYRLSPGKTAVGRWRVDGHAGGLLAGGINSGATGFGADLLLVDDPVKDQSEADSAAHRRRVINEFRSTLMSRVHPGGSVVLVMTRWHPDDLAGTLLRDEPDIWTHVNIPAVAEAGIPDALGRESGVVMTSALGYTADEFAEKRRSVGERTWYALYQGVPAAPEGGLVKRDWLDQWRLPAAPTAPTKTVVGVDPADSGSGDSCGIVAASMTREGVVAVIADVSAPMTSDQWARAAVDLAVDVGASEIAVEGFSARETYQRVVKDALRRTATTHPIKVTTWPPKGSGRGGGDALARSAALLQGLETGTTRIAGYLPDLEQAAVTWQVGQHQPDSLAAVVVAHDVLVHSIGQQWGLASPVDTMRRHREGRMAAPPAWMRRTIGG